VVEVCRKLGVSEKTEDVAPLEKAVRAPALTNELRELRQLQKDNAVPKRLVADPTLGKITLEKHLGPRKSASAIR